MLTIEESTAGCEIDSATSSSRVYRTSPHLINPVGDDPVGRTVTEFLSRIRSDPKTTHKLVLGLQ